jgi:energy-coupling factor transporter ATP-binding protein EcfA2
MSWGFSETVNVKITPDELGEFFRDLLKTRSFLVIVVGDTGSGKSTTVGSLMEKINPKTCRRDVIDVVSDVKPRFREILEERKNGRKEPAVINLDDFGSELDSNDYGKAIAKQTSWLFQKDRPLKIGCFLTVPDKALINKTFRERIPNFYMEVLSHNVDTGYALVKIFRIQVNKMTHKVYHHRLIYNITTKKLTIKREGSNKACIPIKFFKIPKPSPEFMKWYIPFRYDMSVKQLDEEETPQKNNVNDTVSAVEIYNKILSENKVNTYIKGTRKGVIVVDKPLIEADYGIGVKKSSQVSSLIHRNHGNIKTTA